MSDDASNPPASKLKRSLDGFGTRLIVLAALWLALTGGRIAESWYFGVPTVLFAAVVGQRLSATVPPSPSLWHAARFVPFFVWRSVRGGLDVGLRALEPSRPLSPTLLEYETELREDGAAITFFAGVISLLPGTLCVDVDGTTLLIHVVDESWPVREQLADLEERIGRVFGA
ncbi:MAG: Na+/H+ antiporter subunit E [Persicimonas sp.]